MKLNKKLTFLLLIHQIIISLFSLSTNIQASQIINLNKNKSLISSKNLDKYKSQPQYILGPGDVIFIRFLGAQFFNGTYFINNEGFLNNLPELNSVYVNGFTLSELEKELSTKYEKYLFDSSINISINKYRPISVYVYGEIKRPGLYKFDVSDSKVRNNVYPIDTNSRFVASQKITQELQNFKITKLFDVIQRASGVSNYADLSKIIVLRNNPKNQGGGKIKAEINLLTLIENGDQSQNIRIMDGDSILINKTEKMIKEQILSINKSNISPEYLTVFITGNVINPGPVTLKQGASLLQAVASSGGKKIWTGKVEFIRFNDDGTTDKYSFTYNPRAPINTKENPILMAGDIVNVRKTILGQSSNIIGEISSPIIGTYGLYKIFKD